MSRRDYRHASRRLAVLILLGAFLVLLLVVVATARGEEPPPTYGGRTAEEWAALADERLAKLGRAERRLVRARTVLRRLRSSLQAHVRVPGTTGEVRGLLCVQGFEGAWNDPWAPYWGGLQMDWDFMRAYGPVFFRRLGTAERWPVIAQLSTGLAGVLERGFDPWPVSRRRCGL